MKCIFCSIVLNITIIDAVLSLKGLQNVLICFLCLMNVDFKTGYKVCHLAQFVLNASQHSRRVLYVDDVLKAVCASVMFYRPNHNDITNNNNSFHADNWQFQP